MVQMKHFTAPQKMPNFQFSRRAKWPWRDKILGAPQRGQKIIVNQSKPILVIVSIKPFTRQSFRQNYFSREIEWAVFTETASRLIYPGGGGHSHMKQTGMLVVSLRGVNFGFWSRLGCSGQSANILSRQGLV